jgi:hypothetical protein
MSNRSIQDSLSLINTFLEPVRAQAQKEATLKQAADGSFKDTTAAKPQEQMKEKELPTDQTNLGVEQTQAANDSGSTVSSAPDNKEGAGNTFADTQGTQTLTTDDPVEQKGNIGPVKNTEINSEQKVARAENLGNAILEVLYKAASESAAPVSGEQAALDKLAAQAADAAQEYYEGYLYGMLKRAKDEQDLRAACEENQIDAGLIKKAGGISGILDKVAMEFPDAILPEEAGAAPEEAAPIADVVEGEAPVEGDDATVEALVSALDEAGVTAEELAQAVEDVQALQEAGVSPDELAEVMTEVLENTGDEAAAPAAE